MSADLPDLFAPPCADPECVRLRREHVEYRAECVELCRRVERHRIDREAIVGMFGCAPDADIAEQVAESLREYGATVRDLLSIQKERDAQRTRAEAAEAEVARLRAIVEGRTTAPTDVEIDAHAVAFGAWLVRFGVRGVDVRNDPDFARITRDAPNGAPTWWLPLDCAGRPCAWPVIA